MKPPQARLQRQSLVFHAFLQMAPVIDVNEMAYHPIEDAQWKMKCATCLPVG